MRASNYPPLNTLLAAKRENARMAKAIAFTQQYAPDPIEIARTLIVCGCALALILAGQAVPV